MPGEFLTCACVRGLMGTRFAVLDGAPRLRPVAEGKS